ncbi:SDR family oxidoreductase [Sphingosinithalassobacter tenebrarum]|uniref:SDR family oxidoreductase n=2 Tax=Stakelama tenebrarum TaxID=2711215 RepID=A0A6G6Y9Y5_9SPHN|nr:SDR family oxidoreductase [Sphingosinithalassobacter tenebrarum]
MRVFLTGATGFIGSAVVLELIEAGHQVVGMTRSDEGASRLRAAGAQAHRGALEDTESLKRGASSADAVIHCAFDDFSDFVASCEKDRRAIEAIGSVLAGSERPMIVTSVIAAGLTNPGDLAKEDVVSTKFTGPRVSEAAGRELADMSVNVSFVRLPQVHTIVKQGLVTWLVGLLKAKGVSAYAGDGSNRWPAVHLSDLAPLYVLALERQVRGACYNAVAEEGIALRDIAETIGRAYGVPTVSLPPEDAAGHFGWLSTFVTLDMPASSALTRELLSWEPTGPGLLSDLQTPQPS